MACFQLSDGTRTHRSTGTSDRKEAQKIANNYEAAEKLARAGRLDETAVRRTLNDILKRHGEQELNDDTIEEFLRKWVDGKHNTGTNERYARVVDLFLEHLGVRKQKFISNINFKDAEGYIKWRKDITAPKTLRLEAKALSSAFNVARKLGFTDTNPFEQVMALNPIKGKSLERETFTKEESSKLVKTAVGEWKTVVLFGYYTGARLSDCTTMKWSSINFKRQLIDYIAKKNNARVVVPLMPQLEAHLKTFAKHKADTLYVCPTLAEKETSGKSGLSEAFKKIMVKAGIDTHTIEGQGERKFSKKTFHSLRHSFNSTLANENVSQERRMKLIGQSTVAVNEDYTHLNLDQLRNDMEKIPALDF